MDTLPAVVLTGYLLGVLPSVFRPLDRYLRGTREQLAFAAAQALSAMLLASHFAPTAASMAAGGVGALLGIHFPPRARMSPALHVTTAASAAALSLMMPRALGMGAIVFAALFLLTRRLTLSAVIALFVVPWAAWLMRGSDILLIFGAIVWLLLVYGHLDLAERQIRILLRLRPGPLIFRRGIRRAFFVGTLAALFVLFFLSRYVYHGFGLHPEIFRAGSPDLEYIAMTFDDGPHPEYTNQILDALKERDVQATFFVVGRHVDRYPEVVERMLQEGHEVGSHTYHHRNMLNAGEAVTLQELGMTEEALQRAAGHQPRLFRPPRGLYNSTVLDVSHGRGYTMILWSVSSRDWLGIPPSRIVSSLSASVQGGDIVLFHDSGDFLTAAGASRGNTVEAIGPLVDELQGRGYRFVTVSELMVLNLIFSADLP